MRPTFDGPQHRVCDSRSVAAGVHLLWHVGFGAMAQRQCRKELAAGEARYSTFESSVGNCQQIRAGNESRRCLCRDRTKRDFSL